MSCKKKKKKKFHCPNESIPLSNHTAHLLRLILRLSSRGVPVDASKAYFEQFEHESKVCYPCLNECRSMCLLFEILLLRRHDAISTMLNVSSSPQLPINTLFSFWEIIRQVHYNLLLRKKLSREVVKVTHVRAIALALITPSRTNRAGIEMRSSLFDCNKIFDCRKKQNKKKNKQNQNWNKQADKQRGVYKPKTKYPMQTWRLVLVATFIFAHPPNGGWRFTWQLKILPVKIMLAWATTYIKLFTE